MKSGATAKEMRVLLIECNEDDVELIRDKLAQAELKTVDLQCAERLSTGLVRLAEAGADAVLLDLSLPDSQGLATFEMAHAQAPDVPIIVLTGLDDDAVAMRAVQHGAQDYLVKGKVDGPLLVRSIRYAIERQRLGAAQKMAAAEQLAARVAHHINTPLAAIVGHAQQLRMTSLDHAVADRAGKISSFGRRAAQIVRGLQDFAHARPGERAVVHLSEVVERVLELWLKTLRVSWIRVERELSWGLPPVHADEGQLEQVVLNLLLNAEEAVAGSKDRRTITVRLTAEGDRVRLVVADSGPGIASDALPRIFEPFFTTKPVGEGTGLGLSICYGIVQAHGGRIWAESLPGQGATLIVELPAHRPEMA